MTPVIHSQQSVNQHLFELAVAGLSSSSELSSVIKMFFQRTIIDLRNLTFS